LISLHVPSASDMILTAPAMVLLYCLKLDQPIRTNSRLEGGATFQRLFPKNATV